MSLAGVRSNRGDRYQRSIALFWLVKMLTDESIEGVLVEVITIPDEEFIVYGDDIVIRRAHLNTYIQAKSNQTNFQEWKLTDSVLKKELKAAYKQLHIDSRCEFHLYSRTPFGQLERIVEEANLYPEYSDFEKQDRVSNQKDTIAALAKLWGCSLQEAFSAIRRIKIGDHHSSEQWESYSEALLEQHFSQTNTAVALLASYIDKQHSRLGDPSFIIDRSAVQRMLADHGIHPILGFSESQIVDSFRAFSMQGRQWPRSISNIFIQRIELNFLLDAVEKGKSTILLEDTAGGGKTCILLDFVDNLERKENVEVLFIRGDLFATIESLSDLSDYGLSPNLVTHCAFLADKRKLVVVIDSLDVLAVGNNHRSLNCFLGLIAQLELISNISVVVACRSFDLRYDPLLREVEWQVEIQVKPLDYERDVVPILESFGIRSVSISSFLQESLIIPQNLKLACSLLDSGVRLVDIEGHDLYDLYIREKIKNNESLGASVLENLQNIASSLLLRRAYTFSPSYFSEERKTLTRLLSEGVVTQVDTHKLVFSHQTLADALRIQKAVRNGETLEGFILSQPQLPFVRPAVRAFIQFLRRAQPELFTREFRKIITSEHVSVHLKRLALETLAEMTPCKSDISILLALSGHSSILLRRFLDAVNSNDWVELLKPDLMSIASIYRGQKRADFVLTFFEKNFEGNESLVLGVWSTALREKWVPEQNITWGISTTLKNLNSCDASLLFPILEKLVEIQDDHSRLGKVICRYMDSSGQGERLLWKFIVRNYDSNVDFRRGREINLSCQSHDLLGTDDLSSRFKKYDQLFSFALEFILDLVKSIDSAKYRSPFSEMLLDSTSYHQRHTNHDLYSNHSLQELLTAVESALKHRALNNDQLWQRYEPQLRRSNELGIRYLLCEAYGENIGANIEGISFQLTDQKLLRYGQLEYELGMLAKLAYPQLEEQTQVTHQHLLRSIWNDHYENDMDVAWIEPNIYERFQFIPTIYVLPEYADFYEKCSRLYGEYQPIARITSGGGIVQSPVSVGRLCELEDTDLIRLFQHYEGYDVWSTGLSDNLVGGQEFLVADLREAASLLPDRFLSLMESSAEAELSTKYVYAILDGVASHLAYRFGNLEPLPDGPKLAATLLKLTEEHWEMSVEREIALAKSIQAVGNVLVDEKSVSRMAVQFSRLAASASPDHENIDTQSSLVGVGINSARGIAADSIMSICNRNLENGSRITSELDLLLRRYSSDSSMAVRAMVLQHLPFLISKEPVIGWDLLECLSEGASPNLGKHFEQVIYYNYRSNYSKIEKYIEQLSTMADVSSQEVWGRMATLCYLDEKIPHSSLFSNLGDLTEAQKKGIGQVLIANMGRSNNSEKCLAGLTMLMETCTSYDVFQLFASALEKSEIQRLVQDSIIRVFIDNSPVNTIDSGLFNWMETNARLQPIVILHIMESIVIRLSELDGIGYFRSSETIVSIVRCLLQEADLSDDENTIARVLKIHDWFFDNGLRELENIMR